METQTIEISQSNKKLLGAIGMKSYLLSKRFQNKVRLIKDFEGDPLHEDLKNLEQTEKSIIWSLIDEPDLTIGTMVFTYHCAIHTIEDLLQKGYIEIEESKRR
ncbi:hypothetical protein [Gloeothece verrucosa]|uniref:Uncharacterized protein n=1 Tax=Gloeothece verrucosa (strain PCC 7822) TaxID=497965 RepID=E0UAG6_GLOV7|nr:hypothetical protein [Gloeothece verrucosa]ADN12707.1 hypothetical protein Cyan7822_0671 [Gloeothece verrucosa PCC 7822]